MLSICVKAVVELHTLPYTDKTSFCGTRYPRFLQLAYR